MRSERPAGGRGWLSGSPGATDGTRTPREGVAGLAGCCGSTQIGMTDPNDWRSRGARTVPGARVPRTFEPKATSALTRIRSERVRNLVRGALAPDTPRAFRATMERLHRECDAADAVVVAEILGGSLLARYQPAGEAFPAHASSDADAPYFESSSLDVELEAQRRRLAPEEGRIVDAIGRLYVLNQALLGNDLERADREIRSFVEDFGATLTVAWKAASARGAGEEKARDFGLPALAPFWSPKRSVLSAAFEDTTDRERNYLQARRSFVGFARRAALDPNEASLVVDLLSPRLTDGFGYARRLQAFGRRGVVDTVAFMFRLDRMLRREGASAEAERVLAALPSGVVAAWRNSFDDLDPSLLQDFIGREDQFADLKLFSHLPAWSEYGNLFDHRLAIEEAIGERLDGVRFATRDSSSFAATQSDAAALLGAAPRGPSDVEGNGFHRTVALVGSASGGTLWIKDGEELGCLLDRTIDLPHLLSVEEIERLLPPRRPDALYEYYRLVLLNDADPNPTRNHAVRRALQRVLRERHDGDVVGFMRSVDSDRGHVSDHLYELLSEPFLTSLYEIYEHADDVLEAQTRLLEWQGSRRNDADAMMRARSHRLLIRLRRVRGDIESTRIYVDPLRLFEWLVGSLSEDLKALAPFAEDIIADEDRSTSLADAVRTAVQPRARLLRLIDRAYREFCTNKVHGAASFIARRIRHGTLHGHLSVEIAPSIDKAASEFAESSPEFAAYLRGWMRRFDTAVLAMATDRLHVRSKEKPRGLIVGAIDDPDKTLVANAMVLRIAAVLRESSQVVTPIAIILDDCWLLFEVDLRRSREAFERLRADFVIDVGQRFATGRLEVDARMSQTILELNGMVDQRFETAKSWLTRPTNFSPSASVSLLVNAVIDEVSHRHQLRPPILDIPEDADIDLIGHRFHLVYDALFVLVVNAAKYCRRATRTKIVARRDDEDNRYVGLVIEIASSVDPSEADERFRRIEEEMTADVDNAMDIDEQSGLRKVRCIVEEIDEVIGFDWRRTSDGVVFTLSMRYLRS